MNAPPQSPSPAYRGLYAYDFGEWTAFGYTAEEIALLLESEQYRGGKVYRIQRVQPDGKMELCGVATTRFQAESGMFFWRSSLECARSDFESLKAAALDRPAPCRAFMHLADCPGDDPRYRFVVALIYPAEYEHEIGRWLSELDYHGGDLAEGGISHVSNYHQMQATIVDRQQLFSQPALPTRSADEVFATVRRVAQR